jgi:signal transduction histidine kinase
MGNDQGLHLTPAALDCLAGGGEMGERIRKFDWGSTPIGPIESWSSALRMMTRFLLANRFPLLLWWGPEYVSIYNDPYRPILGAKHPEALGQPVSKCWGEIWHILKPLIDTPFNGGPATWDDDIHLEINRHGFIEETHFTIAYSPVPDETAPRGIGGVIATVHEITEKVVGERRLAALRDLGTRPTVARTAEGACEVAAKTLAAHNKDVPFALLYLLDPGSEQARLAGAAGIAAGSSAAPQAVHLGTRTTTWPLAEAREHETLQVVENLGSRFDCLPPGPWADAPKTAIVLPIMSNRQHEVAGFFVAGLSSRLKFDDAYRDFLQLATAQIATAIANARAYEEEKRRAEALAELDRAKTAFFSNVSHEFRTPLTLMLGPIQDALQDANERWQRDRLEMIHRAGLRLQKLVNTLLDFSRIEAGRVQACYEPIDLATLTADLASNFRSACEKAGLRFTVDCRPLSEPVYVDREMWEKVVLNLLSNAFKFTLDGEIEVSLKEEGGALKLLVRDTGTGISAEQLPHIFERFHRVEGARARTNEGTGIGLALIQELVKLHCGRVEVESVLGRGTTFTVTLPLGTAHLPADRIGKPPTLSSSSVGAPAYVEEALRWLPEHGPQELDIAPTGRDGTPGTRPVILVADDNADMRDYLQGLLAPRYEVLTVGDGEAALAAVRRRRPDAVVSDVMMPKLDGLELVRSLRADERYRTLPVILLSARAGEDEGVGGMQAGANDYLIKPFSARELLARVEARLQIARLRQDADESIRQSEAELREAQRVAHVGSWRWDAGTDVTTGSDELYRIYGLDPATQSFPTIQEQDGWLYPHESWERINAAVQEAVRTGEGYELEVEAFRIGAPIWLTTRCEVVHDAGGRVIGLRGTVQDITERRRVEEALRHSQAQLEEADRRKDEFLATLAHELRNPLVPIRNSLHILRLAGADAGSAEQIHEMMERQVSLMVRLVEDLMEVCRITRGKITLRKEPVELSTIVRSAIETSRPLIEASRHQLAISIPAEPLTLEADPVRLAQILANLLNNAAKYTESGGQIWLTARQEGPQVALSVRDNGMGIPPDMLPKVFDLFTQVERTYSRAQGGLGIGLTLVRSLAEMHGGTVEVRSDGPGKGSEFIVRLPLAEVQFGTPSGQSDRRREVISPHRILVVDDNHDSADSLAMLLGFLGAEVATANDGPTALGLMKTYRPSVVLLDIGMPGMDGYEVARRTRQEQQDSSPTIIALTGWGQEEDRKRSKEAGIDYHLVKPVAPDDLQTLLASLDSTGKVSKSHQRRGRLDAETVPKDPPQVGNG